MAKGDNGSDRQSARHGIAIFILLILPGFMFVGMLAPAAIHVQQEEQEEEAATVWNEPLAFRPLSKRPLLVPRDFSAGFVPELVDIESLFVGTEYRAQDSQRISSLPSFPSRRGDTIVLDEVDAYVTQELFEDAMGPELSVDLAPLWTAEFDTIPSTLSTGGQRQFDDFAGGGGQPPLAATPPPVPEPRSGALLGLGLASLGLMRRRRR